MEATNERWHHAVESRDSRFDGWFVLAVTSTGIYCRPSCPTPVQPKRENRRFFPTAAAAQQAGFRACKRCAPDASPGSPEWNVRADLVGRAMRLVADGVVDRDGVAGLADRLAVSERHLRRIMTDELGASPVAIARSQRAQSARILIETTDLPFGDVAFAAGFSSVRQFNDTVREVFATTPGDLRRSTRRQPSHANGSISLRLAFREPFDAAALLDWFEARAVPGLEERTEDGYRRVLSLPAGPGVVTLRPAEGHVAAALRLTSISDVSTAVHRCRRLFDLDADPTSVSDVLAEDGALRPLVARRPGLRLPGAADAFELAVRAVVGQQISVAGARTIAGRLVAAAGATLEAPDGSLTHTFPGPSAVREADLEAVGLTAARTRTLRALSAAVLDGDLDLDAGAERDAARRRLERIPGIGPWTSAYIGLRALGDPDAFPATDLGIRRAAGELGLPDSAADLARRADRWRPWRGYAAQHLWTSISQTRNQT